MTAPPVAVIFHGIGTPGRALEPGEAPFWVTEAAFEAALDRIAALPDPGRVRISLDDGNASDHAIALPALTARGLTADVFVLTGRIGQPGSLAAGEIRALDAAGMRIGSHGVAHRRWPDLAPDALAAELADSRAALEDLLGRPVTAAGIPFGAWTGGVLAALRRAGYTEAWSSDRGPWRPGAFLRPRTSITAATTPAALDAILTGYLPPLARLRRAAGMARRRLMR